MKKFLATCATAFLVVSVFAVDLSFGVAADYSLNMQSVNASHDGIGLKYARKSTENYLGGNIFFDATYVRIGFGADFGVAGKNTQIDGSLGPLAIGIGSITGEDSAGENSDYRETNLKLSVIGKYPFNLGLIDLYPILGFDFTFNVAAKDGDINLRENASEDLKNNLNHYCVVFGAGADIKFGKFFITPTATFGVDLKKPSTYKEYKKVADRFEASYDDNTFFVNVGLGFGYKF